MKVLAVAAFLLLGGLLFLSFTTKPMRDALVIGEGRQPDIWVDKQGLVKMAYGSGNKILYCFSKDGGESFSAPVEVAKLPKLALGMGMAPQIVSTNHYTVIAATNTSGNIYSWRLNHKTQTWEERVQINDVDTIAREGFVGLAAGKKDQVFAVWLDMRGDKQNKVYLARSENGSQNWQKNQLVYQSPDKTVCECCKPAIITDDKKIYVQFRNWLNGSRDLHLVSSADNGKTFGTPQKLGHGTWELYGCPMDGGDLTTDAKGAVYTVWRREQYIYLAQPGQPEERIAEGRNPSVVVTAKGPVIAWQHDGSIFYRTPAGITHELARGGYPKLALVKNKVVAAWEKYGIVRALTLTEI